MSATSAGLRHTRSSSIAGRWCARRWLTPRVSTWTPTAYRSVWSHGSPPTTAWCWSDDRASDLRAAGSDRRDRAVCVDGFVLYGAVRFRAQDQLLTDSYRAAALCAGVCSGARLGDHQV